MSKTNGLLILLLVTVLALGIFAVAGGFWGFGSYASCCESVAGVLP
jgi:hypothetical protein